jgi:hypothetical protein
LSIEFFSSKHQKKFLSTIEKQKGLPNMSILDCELDKNVLSFLEKTTYDKKLQSQLEKKGLGIFDPDLDINLQNGDIPAVLTAFWSEQDLEKRILWLDLKSEMLHPILLFEEAITKFKHNPTSTTFVSESLPLLHSAYFRLLQDAQCSLNTTIKTSIAPRIYEIYRIRLGYLVYKKFRSPFFEYEMRHQNLDLITKKVHQIATKSLKSPLCCPVWIGFTGMNRFSVGQPKMAPKEHFSEIRILYAKERLSSSPLKNYIALDPIKTPSFIDQILQDLRNFF